jgi:hypothetical protein
MTNEDEPKTMIANPSALATPRQLAQRWHISEKTLERWRMQGTGPAFMKLGGRVLYRIDQIEAHERNRMRMATSRAACADNA